MSNALAIARTGMEAQQTQLDVISNNLANVGTNGFKRANAVFEDLLYQNLRQAGSATSEQSQLPTGLQIGLGVRTVATSRSFAQGSLQQSSNQLDVAIKGAGFFQVTMPDGTNAYTRDGSFQVDSQGRLVTTSGYPVASGVTVPPTAQSVSISAEGIVSAVVPGSATPQTLGSIVLANFVNAPGLEPRGQNLYSETAASGAPSTGAPNANGLGALLQGYVETSNVNVVQELVSMIQVQRAYEMNSKAIQTADQMLQKLAQL
ncbi:flagellar basal-body rod protein FlgG [Rhodoferax sp.]|uniref:flagellar basal-body rod protein FlgG n=1 Tax=Rhodoferax sp. TaxID=50421 RepID=UPI00276C66F8|nr:flagellar basal-body rod protein FlgG [Rhodoferax sp.]